MLKRHALAAAANPTQGADEVIISDYTTFASEVSWRAAACSSNRVERQEMRQLHAAEVLQMTQNKGVAAIYDGIGNMTFLQGSAEDTVF